MRIRGIPILTLNNETALSGVLLYSPAVIVAFREEELHLGQGKQLHFKNPQANYHRHHSGFSTYKSPSHSIT